MAEEYRDTLTGEALRPGYALDQDGAGPAGGDVQVFRLDLEGPLPSLEADHQQRAIISHLPKDAELSEGTRTPDQSWSVGVTQLAGLTISVPSASLAGDDIERLLGEVTVTIQDETDGGHATPIDFSLVEAGPRARLDPAERDAPVGDIGTALAVAPDTTGDAPAVAAPWPGIAERLAPDGTDTGTAGGGTSTGTPGEAPDEHTAIDAEPLADGPDGGLAAAAALAASNEDPAAPTDNATAGGTANATAVSTGGATDTNTIADSTTPGTGDTATSGSTDTATSGSTDIATTGGTDTATSGSTDTATSGSTDIATTGGTGGTTTGGTGGTTTGSTDGAGTEDATDGGTDTAATDGTDGPAAPVPVDDPADVGNHAPTAIALSGNAIAENAAGAAIGALSVTDADADDSHDWSIDDDRFEVVGGVLKLKDGVSLDHEAAAEVSVNVTATDAGGLAHSETFTLSVSDANEAPTDIALSAATVAENVPGAAIGTLSVVDPDAGDTITYTVDDDRFEVVGGVLKLKDGVSLDHEAAAEVSVNVTAADAGGLTHSETFTLSVTDANEAPTGLVLSANTVAEHAASGTVVGTVAASDPDSGETFTYALSNDAGGRFAIDAATGEITVADAEALDFESGNTRNPVDVTLSRDILEAATAGGDVTISGVPAGATLSAGTDNGDGSWTVASADALGPLTITPPAGHYGAIELTATADVTETATLIDADFTGGADGFAYADDTFRSTDNARYAGDATTGGDLELRLGGIDNRNIYGMSGGFARTFTVPEDGAGTLSFNYRMVMSGEYESNEYGEVLVSLDGALLGSGGNDYIARAAGDGNGGADYDSGWQTVTLDLSTLSAGEHTLILGGYNNRKTYANEDLRISFDDVRLDVAVATSDTLTVQPVSTESVTVLVTDSGGNTHSEVFAINLTDISEAPTDIALSNASVAENATAGTVVGTASAVHPNSGESVTYALADDAGGRFAIDANTGEITVAEGDLIDYGERTSHMITVRATDSDGNSYEETMSIGVTGTTTIDADTYDETGRGYTVTARSIDALGNLTDATLDNVETDDGRLGVDGEAGAVDDQLGYDPLTGLSEQLIVDFDDAVSSATVAVSRLFSDEGPSGQGEQGHWQAYSNGILVGESDFSAVSGHTMSLNIDLGPDVTFDQLVFSATEYVGGQQGVLTDSSEYFINSIEFQSAALTVEGTDANETLMGGAGEDSLAGGGGDDILMGSIGADTLSGGGGTDTASFADSDAGVTVNLSSGTAAGGDAEGDVLSGIENLTGSRFADELTGDAGDNVLIGNGGSDTLTGMDGSDTFIVGEGGGTIHIHGDGGEGDAAGWTDAIRLQNDVPGHVPDGWTYQLTTGSVASEAEGSITLSEGASGTITLNDGTEIIFDGIERIDH